MKSLYYSSITLLSIPPSLHRWPDVLLSSFQCCALGGCSQICTRVWGGLGDAHHVRGYHAGSCYQRSISSYPSSLDSVLTFLRNPGIRMASFHGNFFVRSTDLLAMPAVPQDQSYAIEIQIE